MSYYLMHRGWMDNDVFRGEPYTHASAWAWLIEHAAFAATKHHGRKVERGQLYTSLGRLARAWDWSRPKVQRYLHTLCREKMTDTVSDTDGTLITICNYSFYQIDPATGRPPCDTDPIQTRYRPDTRNKEGKKEEEDSDSPRGESATPPDPLKAFWTKAVAMLTAAGMKETQARALIGKWKNDFGISAVMAAFDAAERDPPVDLVAFLIGCMRNFKGNGNGRHRLSPGEKLFLGFAQAAEGDFGADSEAPQPLLDRRR